MKNIKLKVIPEINVFYDIDNKTYKVTAIPARCKLLIDGNKAFPQGWCLIKGLIKRRGRDLRVKIIYKNKETLIEEHLPVSCKGTILELIKIPPKTEEIFLEPMNSTGEFEIVEEFILKPVDQIERIYKMFRRVIFFLQKRFKHQRKILGLSLYTPLFNLQKAYKLANKIRDCDSVIDYSDWIKTVDTLTEKDIKAIKKDLKKFSIQTNFLILIHSEENEKKLEQSLNSLENQLFKKFKFIILNNNSKNQIKELIKSNTAEKTYLISLKSGTILPQHALYWIAKVAQISDADLIYTDHDYINSKGVRFNPAFKPDFSLELLRATNYIDLAFAVKSDILLKIDEIKDEDIISYNSHSLLLKIIENTDSSRIRHIPSILFNFPEEILNKKETINTSDPVKEHINRVKVSAVVEEMKPYKYKVIYKPKSNQTVSIIIPTKDNYLILKKCVESIFSKTTYQNYEIIIVDNQTIDKKALEYIERLSQKQVRVLKYEKPFNFSAINNFAAGVADGNVLLFLNNDTEVITPHWLEIMLGCLEQPEVGAVGAKLYYPNGQIQHAGVVIGPGGCADHAFKGFDRADSGYMDRAILQQEYSAVTAACMMTWKSLFIEVGGFDEENLPVSFNDVDYCLKLREAGYKIIFTPHVELYHYESLSRGKDISSEAQARSKREADYIRKKWAKYIYYDPFYNPNLNYKKPDFKLNLFPDIRKPWSNNGV